MRAQRPLLLGAQVSAAGGVVNALAEADELQCAAIQIFTANNRQWSFKLLDDEDVAAYRERYQKKPLVVVAHATYLINLGSPKKLVAKKARKALLFELMRCEQLGIKQLVVHPGSCLDSSEDVCVQQIAELLDEVLADPASGTCMILLENTAGQGSSIGHTFEQLATIRVLCHHKQRIGFCFDTCHACGAGYVFSDKKTYAAMWREFDRLIGLEHLKAMHLNDSERPCGSRVDRHIDIGHGALGLEPFRLILNDPRFADIPKIIETPREKRADHARNLAVLRSLVD